MHQTEFERHIGPENICSSIADSLSRAATLYQAERTTPDSGPEKPAPALTH